MYLQFHWLHASALNITSDDLQYLSDMTQIPLRLFNNYTSKSGTTYYQYGIPGSGAADSIHITAPQSETAYGSVTLKGSFFDHFPDFPVHKFRNFINDKGGNFIRVDLSYIDDAGCLDFEAYRAMSDINRYRSYITGSLVNPKPKRTKTSETPDSNNRSGIPDVHTNHQLIHYGNTSGNYVKLYVNAKQQAKFELTLQDKKQCNALLALYRPESIAEFETTAKGALVKYINFCTPQSIRNKRLKQIDSWRAFLGSPIKPIRWTDYAPTRDAPGESFDAGLQRAMAQLSNLCKRHDIYPDLAADLATIEVKARRCYEIVSASIPDFA